MNNFIFQLSVSFVLGFLFLILARENDKGLISYFCIGFFVSLCIRLAYLFIYGLFSDFSITTKYNTHKQYSIVISTVVTYVLYRIIKQKIRKDKEKQDGEVDDIGKC